LSWNCVEFVRIMSDGDGEYYNDQELKNDAKREVSMQQGRELLQQQGYPLLETFTSVAQLRDYNRNQLRMYCQAYGTKRRANTRFDLESGLARKLERFFPDNPQCSYKAFLDLPPYKTYFSHHWKNDLFESGHDMLKAKATSSPSPKILPKPKSEASPAPPPHLTTPAAQNYAQHYGRLPESSRLGTSVANVSTITPVSAIRGSPSGGKLPTMRRESRSVEKIGAGKFRAALDGSGLVRLDGGDGVPEVIQHAADFFRGEQSPRTKRRKTIALNRYTQHAGFLAEIFDTSSNADDASKAQKECGSRDEERNRLLKRVDDIVKRVNATLDTGVDDDLEWDERLTRHVVALDRATTESDLESLKQGFEKEFDVNLNRIPDRIVRRELAQLDAADDNAEQKHSSDDDGSARTGDATRRKTLTLIAL